MNENISEFLSHLMALLLFVFACMIVMALYSASVQMKDAFEKTYKGQGMVYESKSVPQEVRVGGAEIVMNIYDGLEYPIAVENLEIPANVEVSDFDYSIIRLNKKYQQCNQLDASGKVIKVIYY